MICGPEVMMRFAIMELHRLGMAADRIYLSMERNMKCAVGFCGRCQYGPMFICKDGPVFRFDRIAGIFRVAEI
jgi:NAD(P)H-flavin reductase